MRKYPSRQNLDDLDLKPDLELPEQLDDEAIAQLILKWGRDPLSWAKYFFPHHFRLKTPDFHREIVSNYLYLPNKIQAHEAPRGSAKSTLAEFLTLHSIIFDRMLFVMFISLTEDIAAQRLGSIQYECENNKLFRLFFGDLRTEKWGEKELVLRNDNLGIHCKLLARGLGQQILGIKYLYQRPQRIFVDDPEDIKIAENPKNVDKDERWLTKEVEPALSLDDGKLFIIGTPVTASCLIERVKEYPGVYFKRYSIVTPEGVPLWPEWRDRQAIADLKKDLTARGQLYVYYNEYLCNPLPPDRHPISDQDIIYYELPKADLPEWLAKLNVFIIEDLAIGEKKRNAFSALIVIGVDETDTWYILDTYQAKEDWYKFAMSSYGYTKKWTPLAFGVEEAATQKGYWTVLDLVAQKHGYKPIFPIGIRPDKDKNTRFSKIIPRFRTKRIKFLREGQEALIEQIILASDSPYQDLRDCLAYGEVFCYRPGANAPTDEQPPSWGLRRAATDEELDDECQSWKKEKRLKDEEWED
ncbi:hypothetical protein KKF61_07610 [Patescibacteria group bacterium]|nr:hypothetical protein [Patescibacteria group bacterium]